MSAVIYKELLSLARRYAGIVVVMQLAFLITLIDESPAGILRMIRRAYPYIVGFASLWGATLLSGGALSEERAPVQMEALSLIGVRPRTLVLGKFLALWLLSALIPLSAALPLSALAFLDGQGLYSLGFVFAVQPFLVAFSIAASAEPTRLFRTIGWGAGLWIGGGLVVGVVGELLRARARVDAQLLAATLAVATPAALALAVDRIGGVPLVPLKRLCGLLAVALPALLPLSRDVGPLAWGFGALMAVDALVEPIDVRPGRLGRWLRHPLAAAAYPPLLLALAAALYPYPDKVSLYAGSGYAFLLVALSAVAGRLGRRFVHPLLLGLGASFLALVILEELGDGLMRIYRRGFGFTAVLAVGAVLYLVAILLRWREARALTREARGRASELAPAEDSAGTSGEAPAAALARDPLPERWPAVLVKELTQLMRGPMFLLVFAGCLLFQLFLLIPLVSGQVGVAALPVEVGAVLLAATGLSSERKGGKLDFLLLSHAPSRLVWGKWAAVVMVQLMLFSLGLPILVAAYLAAHADLLNVLPMRLLGLAISACGAAAALWASSVANRLLQTSYLALGAWALFGFIGVFGFGGSSAPIEAALTALFFALLLGACFVELAADQLSGQPSAQTTRRKRLLGLFGLLATAAMIALGEQDRESVLLALLLPIVIMLDALWDAPGEGRPGRPLAPGQRGALGYAAIVSLIAALLYGFGTRGPPGPAVAAIGFSQLVFWVLVSGAARRLFGLGREWMPFVLLGLGLAQALSMIFAEFTRDVFPAGVLMLPALPRLSGDRVIAWVLSLSFGIGLAGMFFFSSPPPPERGR